MPGATHGFVESSDGTMKTPIIGNFGAGSQIQMIPVVVRNPKQKLRDKGSDWEKHEGSVYISNDLFIQDVWSAVLRPTRTQEGP